MTLVLSGVNSRGCSVSSDTMLSLPQGESVSSTTRPLEFPGLLKSFVVGIDICVSFSGNPHFAHYLLRELSERENVTWISTVELCFKYHVDSNYKTDFLLSSTRILVKISEGERFEVKSKGMYWIGNSNAMDLLKSHSQSRGNELSPDEFGNFVLTRSSSVVGGVPVEVNSLSGYFRYTTKTIKSLKHIDGFMLSELPDNGGFSFSINTPVAPTLREAQTTKDYFLPYLGIYVFEAKIGYLYDPLKLDSPLLLENVTSDQFLNAGKEQFGCLLEHVEPNSIELTTESARATFETVSDPLSREFVTISLGPDNR